MDREYRGTEPLPSAGMLDFMTEKQPAARDEGLLALLQERDGRPSEVALRDGRRLMIFNIAWGYDIGDEFRM